MSIQDIVKDLSKASLERSKKYNEGSENYAFAFGWFTTEMATNLDEMGLNKKQMKVLQDRLAKLQRIASE